MNTLTPEQIVSHWDRGSPWPQGCGLDLPAAYERALTVRQLRIARGERPMGYKIGFTNRNIWPRYQVFAPIWGTVWNTTVVFCEGEGTVSLSATNEPRLEPEAVFGMSATPAANASLDDLLRCVEWVAPGFEIVQSHMPGWLFTAPDTVADCGLHARLLVGTRVPVALVGHDAGEFEQRLARARVTLKRGNEAVETGVGANVLDGPLHALHHFLQALRDCPGATDLQPGDVITTGTWTDAWPVQAGQQWTAEFDAPLSPLRIIFT
ncbi:MAG: 4-oxalocrotonate decarboxylase-like protein [Ramlibacter sp.]|jgi:2-oxo-3-hexenedioate decarboxylase|nr:4-oxalocrotonate decarboxylase-like protein [Ramlibacter sp.]